MPHKQATILIIDDEPPNTLLLRRVLQKKGFDNIVFTNDSRQSVDLFLDCRPDIVLLDLMMPHLDGFEVMKLFAQQMPPEMLCPIVVLTADVNPATRHKALAEGAKDFLIKPFDHAEVLLRIDNLLEVQFSRRLLHNHNQQLEIEVAARMQDLEEAQYEVLERLARAAEFRDDDTGQHTVRVGDLAHLLAVEMGLPCEQQSLIRRAAPLHDVGKIGISDLILLKPGKLTSEEFETMQTHARIGATILQNGSSSLMCMAETIALTHHERWNGGGYPCGLKGEEIPVEGRIVAVTDVFDALVNDRPYKKAWSVEDAVAEIQSQSGRHFDPSVVAAFLRAQARNFSIMEST